ncbi:hypothetical protein [Lentibacillus juripiscarius]|uniref:Uncharacterized protein n=1 Tax=Lentibacillus juripiscarius TaxID=257446 RepID=A0ABW5VC44_9BACI
MTLNGSGLAITVYVVFLLASLAVGYLYGWKTIKMTGLFGSQVFVASVIHFLLGAFGIFGWFFYSFGINEALFLGGLVLGAVLLAVSEAALIITLFVQRDKLLETDNNPISYTASEQE